MNKHVIERANVIPVRGALSQFSLKQHYSITNMKAPKSTISIDWLQVLCTTSREMSHLKEDYVSPQADEWGNHRKYHVCEPKEYTIGYEFQKSVMYKKYCVAHIAWCPRASNRDKSQCSIKLANNVLYTAQWHFILGDIAKALGWNIIGLTRLDIAMDCNFFMHGLRPEVFIHKYLSKRNSTYIRCGSNKFSIYGEKHMKTTHIDYIRWGSRSSGVCTYLYNKSKELREKEMKPWIVDRWRSAGLDVKNVWRIEFSISSGGRGLKDAETGLIHTLFIDDIDTQENVRAIFHTYAKQYFNFKQTSNKKQEYVKDMKDATLIDTSSALSMKPTTLYMQRKGAKSVYKAIEHLKWAQEELNDEDALGNMKQVASIQIAIDTLSERSFILHHTELCEKSLEDELRHRMLMRMNEQPIMSRYTKMHSYMDNEQYKDNICKKTAQRIITLLRNRASA